jgi:PAS domain S-box-containing protein
VASADDSRPDRPTPTGDQFRLLVEGVQDYAIFMLDPDGHVRSWNPGAERIKGYSADEVVGKHFSLFFPAEEVEARESANALLARALRDGRVETSGFRVRKDGSRFWANVVISALRDGTGAHLGFAKVTRDLTDAAYRSFVEASNAIVWTAAADGSPNADSPSWRAFTGQTREEWLGRRGWDPVHVDDRVPLAAAWERAKSTGTPFEAEFRLRRHDGVDVWMSARAVPFFDSQGGVREWFGVSVDISARKTAELEREAALELERNARLQAERAGAIWTTTLGSIGDAVIATDVSGCITFMNLVAENLTRWQLAEARGKPLAEVFRIVNEETRQPVESPVEKVLQHGAIVGLANHTVLVRRDGSDLPIDDSAAPIRDASGELFGVVMVFRDVTEQKRAAVRRDFLANAGDALMASPDYRESLATIVKLAVPHLADWCAVDVSEPGEAGTRQLGVAHVDPDRVTFAREVGRRYPPDPAAKTGVPNVIRTGRSELYPEIPRELLEQSAVDAEHLRLLRELDLRSAMIVPLRGRERVFGAITFIYAESGRRYSQQDLELAEELARRASLVIERRKLEEEREVLLAREREARAQAELASRAKDEFLAIVSHELRNPLSAILGWTRLLTQRQLPPEVAKPLATIERNARALARLIEDVLDVSRIISGKLRLDLAEASIVHAVTDAAETVRPMAEAKNIELTTAVEPNISVQADQVRLQQIIGNLLSNAVKFTPARGRVSLEAKLVGARLQISVTDNGSGIDPKLLSAIFEPFRQEDASTTRRHGGLGLGLAIVARLAEAHGGSVRAESAGRGTGATFTVELPARSSSEPPPSTGRPAPIHSPRSLLGRRVLVVDDEPDVLEVLRATFVGAGAVVETANSAETALRRFAESRPDVIVSDIGMPDVDGYMFIQRVRRLGPAGTPPVPAVALTAYVRREDVERALAAGFQAHVAKPVDPVEVLKVVGQVALAAPPRKSND